MWFLLFPAKNILYCNIFHPISNHWAYKVHSCTVPNCSFCNSKGSFIFLIKFVFGLFSSLINLISSSSSEKLRKIICADTTTFGIHITKIWTKHLDEKKRYIIRCQFGLHHIISLVFTKICTIHFNKKEDILLCTNLDYVILCSNICLRVNICIHFDVNTSTFLKQYICLNEFEIKHITRYTT